MRKIIFIVLSMVFMLLGAGSSGATNTDQQLLDGSLIPKFVDPLPVAGDISVVDATTNKTNDYIIHIREFQSQILPSTGVPADVNTGFDGLPANSPTWVWGYLTNDDLKNMIKLKWHGIDPVRPSYLGPVVLAKRGLPTYPTYLNELPYPSFFGHVQKNIPVDKTLDWANPIESSCTQPGQILVDNTCGALPYTGVWPSAVHIHGGEVAPAFDGGPDAWASPIFSGGPQGIGYPGKTYTYPNGQEEATIWFHPHEFGLTRLAVYAGLAGVYPIVDPGGPSAPAATMPKFPDFDIPLIIQDRSFDKNGQLFYNLASNPQPNPDVHPYWIPEFIGDTICVNGKTWPYLEVEKRQYRFRLLDGSNARFYDLYLADENGDANAMPFIAIATDDGYLLNAASVQGITIAPGERYEVIVDFSGVPEGTKILLKNGAGTPYPDGDLPSDDTALVMEFRVIAKNPAIADTSIADGTQIRKSPLMDTKLAHDEFSGKKTGSITRQLTLNEVSSVDGPLELVVNNSKYNLKSYDPANMERANPVLPGCESPLCRETEIPAVGDTEIWEVINITADAHPMHTHLVSFQLLERIPFKTSGSNTGAEWITNYENLLSSNGVPPGGGPPNMYNVKNTDGAIGGNPAIGDFLDTAMANGPEPYEMGWKDTVVTYPDEVTRFVVRWAPQDEPVTGWKAPKAGINRYPFDPTDLINGVGYVWHCHILDHEDNEMMRNYTVGRIRQPVREAYILGDINNDGCVDIKDYFILAAALRNHLSDPKYDINSDGKVDIKDARALTLAILYSYLKGECR